MAILPALPAEARRILDLAHTDRAAAREALGALTPAAQATLLLETPIARRAALLDLVDDPEAVVPVLPPADLCVMARSLGLEEAGWLLSCATSEQLQAAVDIDAWRGFAPDRKRFGEWLAVFADAGEATMLRAIGAIDFELLVLHLRTRVHIVMKTNEDDWEPPAGGVTHDGVFYLVPKDPTDDLVDLMEMLGALFNADYWSYFRMVQGGIWELDTETEEWAHRWRNGRLQDLGFPDVEDAKRIYSFLREDQRAALPTAPDAPSAGEPEPAEQPLSLRAVPSMIDSDDHSILRAIATLEGPELEAKRAAFLMLANRIALADELPLGEPETLEYAVEKAARGTSRGLEHLAEFHGRSLPDLVRLVSLERLFQIGHNIAPEPMGRPRAKTEAQEADARNAEDDASS